MRARDEHGLGCVVSTRDLGSGSGVGTDVQTNDRGLGGGEWGK